MAPVTLSFLQEQLELADQLLSKGARMLEPQDLPGRYGRVVRAVDHLLQVLNCVGAVGGGWAVWYHGYVGCVTQDLEVVLPADRVDDFLRVAAVSGFEILPVKARRWPKVLHKDTGVQVDVLTEGARPGTTARPAPATIPHPARMGGTGTSLRYVTLPALIELKLAAGRARDEGDVVELIRVNSDKVDSIRQHLAGVHPDYVAAFDRLVQRAREQGDN